jgi:hypothetical protein
MIFICWGTVSQSVRVTLQLTVIQSVCLGVEPNLGLLTRDHFFFFCFLFFLKVTVLSFGGAQSESESESFYNWRSVSQYVAPKIRLTLYWVSASCCACNNEWVQQSFVHNNVWACFIKDVYVFNKARTNKGLLYSFIRLTCWTIDIMLLGNYHNTSVAATNCFLPG